MRRPHRAICLKAPRRPGTLPDVSSVTVGMQRDAAIPPWFWGRKDQLVADTRSGWGSEFVATARGRMRTKLTLREQGEK
eukprot:1096744-Rhodomonas_salina.1